MENETFALTICVACGGNHLRSYLDLGFQPLANSFAPPDSNLKVYPLETNVCLTCFHSQLSIAVQPDLLFRDYAYVSGTTKTLTSYFDWFAKWAAEGKKPRLRVLDIASNDGSLLNAFALNGHNVLGVDPATNLIARAAMSNIPTVCDYWPGTIADFLQPVFDIVVAMNVVAHVHDPLKFVMSVGKNALLKSGSFYIQTSQSNMIANREFDTIYHEHVSFFTVRSMTELCRRAGMRLVDVQKTPIHGESYLWTVRDISFSASESVLEMERDEEEKGIYQIDTYDQFMKDALAITSKVKKALEQLRASGFTLWAYGAAAKSNTFINFAGLELNGVFDDNELKQGLISPGGNLPVLSPSRMADQSGKIAVVCTAWNFRKEIAKRIKKNRGHGNDIILTYFPDLSVMTVNDVEVE